IKIWLVIPSRLCGSLKSEYTESFYEELIHSFVKIVSRGLAQILFIKDMKIFCILILLFCIVGALSLDCPPSPCDKSQCVEPKDCQYGVGLGACACCERWF
ncbi:hypothetical protein Anas_09905, partial [Armadillidium nasatum]